jgi:hypothetical protein
VIPNQYAPRLNVEESVALPDDFGKRFAADEYGYGFSPQASQYLTFSNGIFRTPML